MSGSALTLVIVVAVASVVTAAAMHAIVAAFDHLPHAQERELAAARRPDGRMTAAAKLAQATHNTDNAASVTYATSEALGTVAITLLVVRWGTALAWPWWVSAVVAASVAATVSLVLVRALPRQIGRDHPLGAVQALAPYAHAMMVLTTPVRMVVPALQIPPMPEAEDLVEQAQDALEDEDAELLRSVVNLGETLTREVMVPRTDMVTLPSGATRRKAMLLFMRSGFSRVPVVGEYVDDVRGIVYLKDVISDTWDDQERLELGVDDLMREPVFLPESVPVDDLLRRMQQDVFHMAIVIDEFGGVAGLVTIEDALEEIVGEVVDEHDRSQPEPEELPDGAYRVPARFDLDELAELFEVEIDDDDVETVAGLLAKALGRVPIVGSEASVHGLHLYAERAEGRRRRLTQVIVRKLSEETHDDPA